MDLIGGLGLRIGHYGGGGGAPAELPLNDGVIHVWKMDETSSTADRIDSVGTADLTSNNAPGVAGGLDGYAARFQSTNTQSLTRATGSVADQTADFSFSFWYRNRNLAGTAANAVWLSSDATEGFGVTRSANNLIFGAVVTDGDDGATFIVHQTELVDDTWYLVSCVSSDSKLYMWIDGVAATDNGTALEGPVVEGTGFSVNAAGSEDFDIEEVVVWDRAISEANVIEHFDSGDGLFWDTGTSDFVAAAPLSPPASLLAHWKMDEQSGVRYDSLGNYNLTDNNTVGVALHGPVGDVANFVAASSQYLSKAAASIGAASFTVALWVKNDPTGADGWIQGLQISDLNRFNIYTISNNVYVQHYVHPTTVSASIATTPDSEWRFVVAGYNAASGKIFISLNGSALTEAVAAANDWSSGALELGRVATSNYANIAGMGSVGVWTGVLDAAEITSLFNSGTAKAYADLTAAEKVGLVSYYDASVDGTDAHASNDLTNNNGVTFVANTATKLGNAARFVTANSESLSFASPAEAFRMEDTDFSVSFWYKGAGSMANPFRVIGRNTTANQDWLIYIPNSGGNTGKMHFYRNNAFVVNTDGNFATDTDWHFVVMWYDSITNTSYIQIDDGTPASGAATTVVLDGAFRIGAADTTPTDFITASIDEVSIFNIVLSSDRRAFMFGSGTPPPFPFVGFP